MRTKGYDCFFTVPGIEKNMICRVCGSYCTVVRNVHGPTSWASSLSKKYVRHDQFVCPHTNEDWHTKAKSLVQEIEKCPSERLVSLMNLDLQELLRNHKNQNEGFLPVFK